MIKAVLFLMSLSYCFNFKAHFFAFTDNEYSLASDDDDDNDDNDDNDDDDNDDNDDNDDDNDDGAAVTFQFTR